MMEAEPCGLKDERKVSAAPAGLPKISAPPAGPEKGQGPT